MDFIAASTIEAIAGIRGEIAAIVAHAQSIRIRSLHAMMCMRIERATEAFNAGFDSAEHGTHAKQFTRRMQAYAIAASAGSHGNVGKLCPAGDGESDQRACSEDYILRFSDSDFIV
jgi:hypothetical protein